MKKINGTLFIAMLILLPASVFAQELSKSFSGIKKISLSTASGDCILKKATGNEVNVSLKHTYGPDYNPTIEQEGDKLVIKENMRNGSYSGSARWTLTIPDGIELKVNTGSGNLEASNLKMELRINTGSGDLSLTDVSGSFDTNTGSGDLEMTNFSGEMAANTGSGSIKVDRASGEVKFNCGSGNIRLMNSQAAFKANVGSGNIEAENITIKGESSFNSGSGDVEVILATSPQYDIALNSGSGDAALDFNGNKIEGKFTMKANKKNGEIEAPFKFDHEEEIDQGNGQVVIKKTATIGSDKVNINIGTGSGTASVKE